MCRRVIILFIFIGIAVCIVAKRHTTVVPDSLQRITINVDGVALIQEKADIVDNRANFQ